MADTQFVDDYVDLLRAKGNSTIFAWRTPDGEVYYGDQSRVQETGVERVSQVEDITATPAPTAAPTEGGGAPVTRRPIDDMSGGDDSSRRNLKQRIDIKDMDAAELSEASKAALMTFSGINAVSNNPVMEALASATGLTGAALGKIIADNNMATLNAINLRAQELGINIDTEGNVIGMTPEQLEEIKTKTAFERGDGAPDFSTREGRQAASRRASQRDITGEVLGMEKEGLFGMEWSREQQDRIRSEFLGEAQASQPAQAPAPAPVQQAPATAPSQRTSSGESSTGRWSGRTGRETYTSGRHAGRSVASVGSELRRERSQSGRSFANGGLIERGQTPEDPMAAPMGVNPGTADDLQRDVSEGEFVVPKDVVDSKGEEFFQKLITSTREAKAKMAEEKAAAQAAQEGQGQQVPPQPQPAPPSNVQPGMTGMLTLPQGAGAARRPLI